MNIQMLGLIGLHVCINNDVIHFDSFGVKHVPKEVEKFIGNKNIKTNIFRIQAYNSIMCELLWIGFIDFIVSGKTLIDYTSLFSPYHLLKNDNIILSYFTNGWFKQSDAI